MAKRAKKTSQKQKSNLFLIYLLVLVGLIIGFLVFQRQNNRQAASVGQMVTAQVQTIKEEQDSNQYSAAIAYPHIAGLTKIRTQETVNTKIKELIVATTIRFKHDVQKMQSDNARGEYKNSLDITYQIIQANDHIISIAFTISEYMSGAAHPNSYTIPFNYSLSTNRELTFTKIFKEPARVIPIISEYATKELLEKYPDFQDFIQEGAAPRADNFQKFVLTQDDLVIIFDPYQVGPYAAGVIKIAAPNALLSSYLTAAWDDI